jgi:hypothetical protein
MGILPALVCSAAAQEPCKLTAMGTEAVAGIRDGRTLSLADGRELRLAAIEVTDKSLTALQSLVEGRDVRLKQLSRERDRYERLVAFVQQVMLKQDQARVSARIGGKACADVLLSAERTARMSHRGQWPTPISPPCSQKILPGLRLRGGQFVLVEGKVLSVRENGATIYSNLGRRWTRDFIVTIPKRHRREFAAAGIDPNQLEGHPIRVRGWIEQHSGPVIEAAAPEQIELAR